MNQYTVLCIVVVMLFFYASSNASTKYVSSRNFSQLADLYDRSDAQRRLDEQTSRYREKAKKNTRSFGHEKVDGEKEIFRIRISRPNSESVALQYGERIPPFMISEIRKDALGQRYQGIERTLLFWREERRMGHI